MTILHIAVFILSAWIIRSLGERPAAMWLIFAISILSLFWLQPVSPIRTLDYWLPAMMIALSILTWLVINPKQESLLANNQITLIILPVIIIGISLLRYAQLSFLSAWINPTKIGWALLFVISIAALVFLMIKGNISQSIMARCLIIIAILIFIAIKYEPLTTKLSYALRKLNHQSTDLASAQEIAWVGYSYFAFRLIHVIRDWQTGRKISINLREFIAYIFYFPAIIAGPIARIENFAYELQNRANQVTQAHTFESSKRIMHGVLCKFILADSLSLMPLNTTTVQQASGSIWMWIIIYAYALRLYLDFSGYTEIAIGISGLLGIKLPENFQRPYLSENLTIFWNRWHITLTQWFRTYYFNPLTRFIRTYRVQLPAAWIIFLTQMSTMLLIGLWHGINLNFIAWGFWNGLGLFLHNRWSEWSKQHFKSDNKNEWVAGSVKCISIFLTFNFIALGWVWFAMPTLNDSIIAFAKLFGF